MTDESREALYANRNSMLTAIADLELTLRRIRRELRDVAQGCDEGGEHELADVLREIAGIQDA